MPRRGAAPDLVDLHEEAAPVEEAGQLVDVREAAQELLQLLVRGDAVADGQAEPAAADLDDPRRDLDRHALSVARDLHGLVGERAGLRERRRSSPDELTRLRGEDVLGGHRQQLRARVAERQARRLVDFDEPSRPAVVLEAVHEDDVTAGVEERPVAALALELLLVSGVQGVEGETHRVASRDDGEDDEAEEQGAQDPLHGDGAEPLRERDASRARHEDEVGPPLHPTPPGCAAHTRTRPFRRLTCCSLPGRMALAWALDTGIGRRGGSATHL